MNTQTTLRLAAWLPAVALLAASVIAGTAHAESALDRIKQRGKLVVGTDGVSPPFGFLNTSTQKVDGFQVRLGADIARRLGVKLETVDVTASTRVQFLKAGKVDLLIANIQWTKERSGSLSYAPTPYNMVGGAAIVAKNSGINSWEDLRGKVVCDSQGSNFTEPLEKTYGATVKGLRGIPESLLALKGGVCVASVHVQPSMYDTLHGASAKEWTDYRLATSDQLIPSPTVIWTRRGDNETKAYVDGVIRDWLKTGFELQLAKQYGVPYDYIEQATAAAQQGKFDHAPPEIEGE